MLGNQSFSGARKRPIGLDFTFPAFMHLNARADKGFDLKLATLLVRDDKIFDSHIRHVMGILPDTTQEQIDEFISYYTTTHRPIAVRSLWEEHRVASQTAQLPTPVTQQPLRPSPSAMAAIGLGSYPAPAVVQQPGHVPDLNRALAFAGNESQYNPSSTDWQATALVKAMDLSKLCVLVEILRSYASPSALVLLPEPRHHDSKSYVVEFRSALNMVASMALLARFSRYIVDFSHSTLLNLMTNNWKDVANVKGFNIDINVASDCSPNEFLNECTELFRFLSAIYHYPYATSPFKVIVDFFIDPLRDIVGDMPVQVVSLLVHKYLRKLHVNAPLAIPLQTHVNTWVSLHGIPFAGGIPIYTNYKWPSMIAIVCGPSYPRCQPQPHVLHSVSNSIGAREREILRVLRNPNHWQVLRNQRKCQDHHFRIMVFAPDGAILSFLLDVAKNLITPALVLTMTRLPWLMISP